MEHEVHTVRDPARELHLGQIANLQVNTSNMIQIAPLASDQAIRDSHAMPPPNQFLRQVRSNEPGAACDQKLSHATILHEGSRRGFTRRFTRKFTRQFTDRE